MPSPAQVTKNDGFDPQHLDEYHLHRLDGTQNCAKVRVCNDAVTTDAEVARLGVNPDDESWPQGAIAPDVRYRPKSRRLP